MLTMYHSQASKKRMWSSDHFWLPLSFFLKYSQSLCEQTRWHYSWVLWDTGVDTPELELSRGIEEKSHPHSFQILILSYITFTILDRFPYAHLLFPSIFHSKESHHKIRFHSQSRLSLFILQWTLWRYQGVIIDFSF